MAKAKAKKAGKKVPCTCGCGLDVAPSTKQNHLKGKGTTALRARVFAETKSLTMVDGPQHEHQNNRNRGSRKRPASNPDEGGINKRLKPSQLESSAEPNVSIFQADIDPMDQLEASTEPDSSSNVQAVPLPALSTQSNNVVGRTKHAIEQRWGSRHCDEDEDDGDEDNEGQAEEGEDEEDEDEEDEDEDEEDEDEDEEDEEDEDEDYEDYEDENERPGLSAWDLLGEAFEREAAALGLS
jgi:hypothetical protein